MKEIQVPTGGFSSGILGRAENMNKQYLNKDLKWVSELFTKAYGADGASQKFAELLTNNKKGLIIKMIEDAHAKILPKTPPKTNTIINLNPNNRR